MKRPFAAALAVLFLASCGLTPALAAPPTTLVTADGVTAVNPAPAAVLMESSGNVANATATATLPAAANKTNYLAGLSMTSSGATAVSGATCTVTGLLGGTMTFIFVFQALASTTNQPTLMQFSPPLPASAPNVAIVASCPAGGSGSVQAAMNAWGFQQ